MRRNEKRPAAKRRRRPSPAPAAVTQSAAPAPTREQLRRVAYTRAAAAVQAEIDEALRQEQARYEQDTGRPMPKGIDEIQAAADLAGWSAQEVVDGNFTMADVHRRACAMKTLRDERTADEIAAKVPPPITVDEHQRVARSLSAECRKVLAALHEWGAFSLADKMRRDDIERRTGLSKSSVRNVMERQLPYLPVVLVATRKGPGGGVWLTPEGEAVAATIEKNVLPTSVDRTQKKRIR